MTEIKEYIKPQIKKDNLALAKTMPLETIKAAAESARTNENILGKKHPDLVGKMLKPLIVFAKKAGFNDEMIKASADLGIEAANKKK